MLDDREVQVVGGSEEEKKAPSSELNVLPDGLEKAASKAEVAKELEAKGAEQEAESCREEAREIVQKQLGGLDGFDR